MTTELDPPSVLLSGECWNPPPHPTKLVKGLVVQSLVSFPGFLSVPLLEVFMSRTVHHSKLQVWWSSDFRSGKGAWEGLVEK